MTETPPMHLAVALDGAGWHPAAWREPDASPDQLFTAAYWAGLAAEAEYTGSKLRENLGILGPAPGIRVAVG